MNRADQIRSRFQDRVVNVVSRNINVALSFNQTAVWTNQYQICNSGCVVGNTPTQHQKTVGLFRISRADVTVAQIAPSMGREQSITECALPFATGTDLNR